MTTVSRTHRGFSLAELILALAITATAYTGAVGLMKAVADSWQTNDDISDAVNSSRNALTRLRTIVKQAKLFGYRDNSKLLFWANDGDGDFQINYIELQMVRYQPSGKKLELLDVYFPAGTAVSEIAARSTVLTPSDIASGAMIGIMEADPYVRVRPLAYEIQQFSMALDTSSTDSRFVQLSLAVKRKNISQELHTVVNLRAPAYYLLEQ